MQTTRGRLARGGKRAAAIMAVVITVTALAGCRGHLAAAGPSSAPAGQASAATAGPGTIPVGSSAHAISVDGVTRSYLIYRPADLPAAARLP